MRNDAPLASVAKALRLLVLLRERGSLSVAEAATALSVTRPTAYRLLATLRAGEFAVQSADRRYHPGRHLASAHATPLTAEDLRRVLRPRLDALQRELGETVNLWVLEGSNVRNFDGIESSEALAIRVNAFDRVPAYRSAAGKSLLAELTNDELDRLHGGVLPPWRSEQPMTIPALKRHLQIVRRTGYAMNVEEAAQGVCGVGIAVRGPDGTARIALSCGVPRVRFARERQEVIIAALRAAAADMSATLAVSGPRIASASNG